MISNYINAPFYTFSNTPPIFGITASTELRINAGTYIFPANADLAPYAKALLCILDKLFVRVPPGPHTTTTVPPAIWWELR